MESFATRRCRTLCWIAGGLLGLFVIYLLRHYWDVPFLWSLLIGLGAFFLLGWLITLFACPGDEEVMPVRRMPDPVHVQPRPVTPPETVPPVAPAASATAASVSAAPAAAPKASAPKKASSSGSRTAAKKAAEPRKTPAKTKAPAKKSAPKTKAEAAAAPAAVAAMPAGQPRTRPASRPKAAMKAAAAATAAPKPAPKAAAKTKAAPKPAPKPASKPAPKSAPKAKTEPKGPAKPEGLKEARGGKADDLKIIVGIGPALEKMLHGMGVYHFDQIAAWKAPELAWVDDNLEGFKGRASRDKWVAQAKKLAKG